MSKGNAPVNKSHIRTREVKTNEKNVGMKGQLRKETAHHRNRQAKRAS